MCNKAPGDWWGYTIIPSEIITDPQTIAMDSSNYDQRYFYDKLWSDRDSCILEFRAPVGKVNLSLSNFNHTSTGSGERCIALSQTDQLGVASETNSNEFNVSA